MANCGFSEEKAKSVEAAYHDMYKVSDQWVQTRLGWAARDGYITVAFGLRLRTPMMQRTIMNTRSTPYEAVAEGRTAGNAMGQSYCMLNSRAAHEFLEKVRNHPDFRLRIGPCAQIHDAQYYIVDDDISVVHWVNVHLVQAVQWQALPEIQHPDVRLGGQLSIFFPNWSNEYTIPNYATPQEILNITREKP